MLLARASRPHVAFLGRIPGTNSYSDLARHPENEPLPGVIAFRPEAVAALRQCRRRPRSVMERVAPQAPIGHPPGRLRPVGVAHIDLAGSRMLHELHDELAQRGIALRIVGAHGRVRDLLRPTASARRWAGERGTTRGGAF